MLGKSHWVEKNNPGDPIINKQTIPHRWTNMSRNHVRFETYCLFCGKTWSVALGSPTLACTCGANINVLKDLSAKAAQDLEEKVYNVLMDTWQEKLGETRKRQLPPIPAPGAAPAQANAPAHTETTKTKVEEKKTTLIVQCPRCSVNVIVPDVKVFQCGSCGQYMTIEKSSPISSDLQKGSDSLTQLSNDLTNSSSSSVLSSSSSSLSLASAPS